MGKVRVFKAGVISPDETIVVEREGTHPPQRIELTLREAAQVAQEIETLLSGGGIEPLSSIGRANG